MEFCDLDCRYASFPQSDAVDGSRSCRTFVALQCSLKKQLVHKNLPCRDKRVRKNGSAETVRKGKSTTKKRCGTKSGKAK
ncbi:MAG: hypothetical protein AB1553_15795 [Nitrospirota bacterium]